MYIQPLRFILLSPKLICFYLSRLGKCVLNIHVVFLSHSHGIGKIKNLFRTKKNYFPGKYHRFDIVYVAQECHPQHEHTGIWNIIFFDGRLAFLRFKSKIPIVIIILFIVGFTYTVTDLENLLLTMCVKYFFFFWEYCQHLYEEKCEGEERTVIIEWFTRNGTKTFRIKCLCQ